MGLKDFGKLTKLTIESEKGGKPFEVMFNPESYSETFSTEFKKVNTTNSGIEEYSYIKSLPPDFKLKFIIDGTGVSDYHDPNLPVFKKLDESVYDQVNTFLGMAWYPDNGKPTPLIIRWNKFIYHCLLKDVTINYTLFSREGLPLRAELDASFIGNTEKNTEYYKSRFNVTGSLNSPAGASSKPASSSGSPASSTSGASSSAASSSASSASLSRGASGNPASSSSSPTGSSGSPASSTSGAPGGSTGSSSTQNGIVISVS